MGAAAPAQGSLYRGYRGCDVDGQRDQGPRADKGEQPFSKTATPLATVNKGPICDVDTGPRPDKC